MPVLVVVLLALLAGCVRTEPGMREVRTEEAVSNRVSAALEYLQMDRPAEARQHLRRALELDNRNARTHNAMALLYRYEEDPEREEEHYRLALRADRDYAPARTNLGTLYMRQGRFEDAIRELERAADNPDYDRRSLAYENLGRAYVELGREEDALHAFNRAVRLDRHTVRPYMELSGLYLRNEDPRRADQYFREYTSRIGGIDNLNARGLWLGIRVADLNNNDTLRRDLEQLLEEEYPDSREFRAWQEWREQQGGYS